MSALSRPLRLRGVTLANRIMVSPMCTYGSAGDGLATDWHFAHYGRLAMGGAAMVMLEATSVSEVGRHSHADLGIWDDAHLPGLRRIAGFIRDQIAFWGEQARAAGIEPQ